MQLTLTLVSYKGCFLEIIGNQSTSVLVRKLKAHKRKHLFNKCQGRKATTQCRVNQVDKDVTGHTAFIHSNTLKS